MKMRHLLCLLIILPVALVPGRAAAEGELAHVFGWVEAVRIMPWNVKAKAKMDTGALTSSLHATDIERFEREGEEWVRFQVELENQDSDAVVSNNYELPVFRNVLITGAGDGQHRRAVVMMNICFGGIVHEEQFSLEDRSNLIYPVLIGRRTIQHLGVIDVTRTFLNEPNCDEGSPVEKHDARRTDDDIGD